VAARAWVAAFDDGCQITSAEDFNATIETYCPVAEPHGHALIPLTDEDRLALQTTVEVLRGDA
jgi:hypothetical protein